MIHSTKQELTLSVPLTLTSHGQAQLFYQQHTDPHKAKQVYLNTLAVEAVRTYLSWLGINSDLQASDSWDPIIQTLSDVADLALPGQGKLECRPVLPGATTCYIPPETNADRIGYLPVLFDSSLETATLLGFVSSADISTETEEISLSQLQPVTSLLDSLKPSVDMMDQPTYLGKWLKGAIESGWQSVETLLAPKPMFSFRSSELANPMASAGAVVRVKRLEFESCQVALVVGIAPSDTLQSDIWVKLCPVDGNTPSELLSAEERLRHRYLPEAIEIRILDDQNVVVMEAQSRQTDMLQLNFRGMLNEQFTIEVALNDVSLIQRFVI